jgi:hypothetical protein
MLATARDFQVMRRTLEAAPSQDDADARCLVQRAIERALGPFGLRFVSVAHHDNSQKSIKEAMALDRAYRSLLG